MTEPECTICGTILDAEDDPMSRDCGGDCWGCIGQAESGHPPSHALVAAEILAGLRTADGTPLRDGPIDDAAFYARCAALLGTVYDCLPFEHAYRTRWNNRRPGGGRFPGFGLVRAFGDDVQIALHTPTAMSRMIVGRRNALAEMARALTA